MTCAHEHHYIIIHVTACFYTRGTTDDGQNLTGLHFNVKNSLIQPKHKK